MATRAVGTPSQRRACDAGDGRAAGPRAAHRSVCGSATLLVVRRCATATRLPQGAAPLRGRVDVMPRWARRGGGVETCC